MTAVTAQVGILLVQLQARRVGLLVEAVRHIVRAAAIAPLPQAPAIVEGVLDVRGRLVPVLDVRGRFGLPATALDPDQHFVIADAGPRLVALRVDRALAVIEVAAELLEPAEGVVPHAQHVAALARLPDGVLVIHDLERFLSLEEGAALDEAITQAAVPAGERRDAPA